MPEAPNWSAIAMYGVMALIQIVLLIITIAKLRVKRQIVEVDEHGEIVAISRANRKLADDTAARLSVMEKHFVQAKSDYLQIKSQYAEALRTIELMRREIDDLKEENRILRDALKQITEGDHGH